MSDIDSRVLVDSDSLRKTTEDDAVEVIEEPVASSKELDKIYRKLDFRIIPALWTLYFLGCFGGSAYGVTLTMNRETGHSLVQQLNLTPNNLSTATALSYVGTIIFDLPMNLIMTKVSPQTWLARILISIGLMYSCYSALKNYRGLYAVQFIFGVVAAGTWPGMSYYITLWYPNARMTKRVGYYYTGLQISLAVAGLVSAGFQKMDGVRGFTGYQWLFIIYGVITVAFGFAMLWWLPERPFKSYKPTDNRIKLIWRRYFTPRHPLNERERELHRRDMIAGQARLEWGWRDIYMILTDLRLLAIGIMYFGVVGTSYGLGVFGSTIIAAQHPQLSSINVSLLYAPIWLFDLGGILTISPFADRFKQYRYLFFSGGCIICIVGMIVTTFAKGPWNKYGGLLIAGYGLGPTVPVCMSWCAEIFESRYGDIGASCATAAVTSLGNLGSVTATYALYSGWPDDANRMFLGSNMVIVGMLGASIAASLLTRFLQNKIRQLPSKTQSDLEETKAYSTPSDEISSV